MMHSTSIPKLRIEKNFSLFRSTDRAGSKSRFAEIGFAAFKVIRLREISIYRKNDIGIEVQVAVLIEYPSILTAEVK